MSAGPIPIISPIHTSHSIGKELVFLRQLTSWYADCEPMTRRGRLSLSGMPLTLAFLERCVRHSPTSDIGKMFDEQGSPRMYSNILLSTDGSEVARKGVEHGLALAKALNAKATVITV